MNTNTVIPTVVEGPVYSAAAKPPHYIKSIRVYSCQRKRLQTGTTWRHIGNFGVAMDKFGIIMDKRGAVWDYFGNKKMTNKPNFKLTKIMLSPFISRLKPHVSSLAQPKTNPNKPNSQNSNMLSNTIRQPTCFYKSFQQTIYKQPENAIIPAF